MKAIKLLLAAIIIIAAIVGASRFLGGSDSDTIQTSFRDNKLTTEISKLIKDGESTDWDNSLKVRYYNHIETKINTYRRNHPEMITAGLSKDLKRSLDLIYMDILVRAVQTTIPNCNLNNQLINEVNSFYHDEKEHNGIKDAYQQIQHYNTAHSVMKRAADLKNKMMDTFDDEGLHGRAVQLKQINLICKCKRIKEGLQQVDADLATAHLQFLKRQADIYMKADYSGIKDKIGLLNKLQPIFDNMDEFERIAYYPSGIKSQGKSLINSLQQFLEDMEKQVLNQSNDDVNL